MRSSYAFAAGVVSSILAVCGHQVTPDRSSLPGGLQPGQMQIKFSTQEPLDFTNWSYVIAINTGQNPNQTGEPYAINTTLNNYQNLDFTMSAGMQNGQPSVTVVPYVNVPNSTGGTAKVPGTRILPTPDQLVLNPNCNGQQTQFCITFDRSILRLPGFATPAPCFAVPGQATAAPTAAGTLRLAYQLVGRRPRPGRWYRRCAGTHRQSGSELRFFGRHVAGQCCNQYGCIWQTVPGWTQAPAGAAQIAGGQVLNAPGP